MSCNVNSRDHGISAYHSELQPERRNETDRKTVKEERTFIWDYRQQNVSHRFGVYCYTAVEDLIFLLSYVCLQILCNTTYCSKFPYEVRQVGKNMQCIFQALVCPYQELCPP